MKYLAQLSIFVVSLFFLLGSSSVQQAVSQEREPTQAERELAEELEIERRLDADIEAQIKAERKHLEKQKKEHLAKERAKRKRRQASEKKGAKGSGSITINGKKIEFNEEDIEAWAEKHAQEWEAWGEKFERNMESWAKKQEAHWEKWADSYSERWENWAEQLESGEFDGEEIEELVEKNLEMLSEMPLGQMVDQVLRDGVGELGDAPWESLGELSELAKSAMQQPLDEFA